MGHLLAVVCVACWRSMARALPYRARAPPAIAALIEEAPYSRLFVLVSARSGLCMGGATGSNLAVICLGRWQ